MATAFERDIIGTQATLAAEVGGLTKSVDGLIEAIGGRDGLAGRMLIVEERQNECPARDAARVESRRRRWEICVTTASPIIAAASVVVAVIMWADSRNSASSPRITSTPSKSRHFTNGSLAEAFCDIEPDP